MSYLDTRDLGKRLDELEGMEEAYQESQGLPMPEAPLDDDEQKELDELRAMRDEISEWIYGETLIPEDDFEDYARELARDLGIVTGDESWPLNQIDWEAAAEDLKADYVEVTYQGVTYLARSC